MKTWAIKIKANLESLSGPRVFVHARWRKNWVNVSSELAQDRRYVVNSIGDAGSRFALIVFVHVISWRRWQKIVRDQLTVGTSRSVIKPMELSLDKFYRYASDTEAAPRFHSWFAISAFYAKPLDEVDRFKYLGSMLTTNGQGTEEIRSMRNLARSVFSQQFIPIKVFFCFRLQFFKN